MANRGGGIPTPLLRNGGAAGDDMLSTRVAGDASDRFVINADGTLEWGDGTAALDVLLKRPSIRSLQIENQSLLSTALILNAAAGNSRSFHFASSSSNRWSLTASTTAEGGSNSGSNLQIIARDDAGAFLFTSAQITRSSSLWEFTGNVQPIADNGYDLGASDTAGWRNLYLAGPRITKGSGTGYTLNDSGAVRSLTFKCTLTFAALAAAALTADKIIATLPAKTRIKSIYADVTTKFIGGAVTAATIKIGSTVGGAEVLASFDCFTAAITRGLADADLGTSLVRAAAIQGGYMPSFTATTGLNLRITTVTANTNALTQGSITIWIECEVLQ